ncbi:MAG: hypothetical protein FWD55_06370 [Propionibacteriaceae bacterium]|nr:hypothetical protein [Propionibacteriaceae bacterium]
MGTTRIIVRQQNKWITPLAVIVVVIALGLAFFAGRYWFLPEMEVRTPVPSNTSIEPSSAPGSSDSSPKYYDLPVELQGTWCRYSDDTKCINLADVLTGWSEAYFKPFDGQLDTPEFFTICLDDDCPVASQVGFLYFGIGVSWNCQDMAAEYGMSECDPDYTSSHDVTKPRLTLVPNHQHGRDYIDSEALYLNPSATGIYDDLSVVASF